MTKRSRRPVAELFNVTDPETGMGADVMLERMPDPADEAAELAPVTDIRLADIAPATGDIGGAERSSDEWRLELIPQLETKLGAAKARAADAENALAIGELSLALGHDGAESNLAELRDRQRLAEIEANGLLRAIKRAEAELKAAERRESAVAAEKRIARAVSLVRERIPLCVAFDTKLRELGAIADSLASSTTQLARYTPETRIHGRLMNLPAHATGAAWYASETLARMFELSRLQPLPKMRPLAEQEAAMWSMFCHIDLPKAPVKGWRPTALAAAPIPAPDCTEPNHADPVFDEDAPTGNSSTPLNAQLGAGGATVLRRFGGAGGAVYREGDTIPGEIILGWPLRNRRSLEFTGFVEYLPMPESVMVGADTAAGDEAAIADLLE